MFEFDNSKEESSYELQDRSLNNKSPQLSPNKESNQKIVIRISNISKTPQKQTTSMSNLDL